ncbi:AmmeMemoRadiSam system protein B [Nanoarchaeota archaeon]
MIRKPIVSGTFYEADRKELIKQIEDSFKHEFGPGTLPNPRTDKEIKAIIAPHAGYPYSGPCQAFSYKALAESKFPDVYIILGTNHQTQTSCTSNKDFETPLGTVKLQDNFIKELNIDLNEQAHENEHSIEVQLPFLQFISENNKDKLKIVPIIVGIDYADTAEKIIKALQKTNLNPVFIISTDFTHYGMSYGFVPFQDNVKEKLHNLDKGAIDHILKIEPLKFNTNLQETGATICGRFAIMCLLEILNNLKDRKNIKSKLLKYYTSGDIARNYRNSVGYASILFE